MAKMIGELVFLQELAERFKIPVPEVLHDPSQLSIVRTSLKKWGQGIIKPDVLSGKRGKAGTVKVVKDYQVAIKELKRVAATEVHGHHPRTAYMVEYVPADLEVFSAVTYSSRTLGPVFTISLKGGMDVEQIPDKDKISIPVNVFQGLNAYQASEALTRLGLEGKLNSRLALCFVNQWDMFISTGMQSCEINPWRVQKNGTVYACDFKATFDESNFKSRDLGFDWPEYPTDETEFVEEMTAWAASSHQGQAHVADLGGSRILPFLFGGGASTITVETLYQLGGDPIFLSDFGGNPPYERMKRTAAICFKHHLAHASMLLILGGKANNTQIDVTFAALADALQEWVDINGPIHIPCIVGRGGPGLIQGFAVLKKTLENIGMPYVFFGPDTPITLVAAYAARLVEFVDQPKEEETAS